MTKLMCIAALALIAVGCGDNTEFESVNQCKVDQIIGGVLITCGDTQQIVYNGTPGLDGTDGHNGNDGTNGQDGQDSIQKVYDPCGNGPGADEIVLKLANNQFMAWYLNLGLVLLDQNVVYQTTDAQHCKFKIVNNLLVEVQ
jgi:hypothetical protein